MSKELEALKRIKNFLGYNYCSVDLPNELKCVKEGLERLEAIDNANYNEALNCLYKIAKQIELDEDTDFWEVRNAYAKVEQALLKAQEQEKVLEIIKEKLVNIVDLYQCVDLYTYNSLVKGTFSNGVPRELTQEEFELLKRWVEKDRSDHNE